MFNNNNKGLDYLRCFIDDMDKIGRPREKEKKIEYKDLK